MTFSLKVKSFTVTGETEQEAYIKGCKHYAKYMASKKYTNLSFKIERVAGAPNAFTFTLYTNIDVNAEQRQFCKMCKEMHCSFFVNEEYNCARCNLKSFLKRVQQKGNISKGFYMSRVEDKHDE